MVKPKLNYICCGSCREFRLHNGERRYPLEHQWGSCKPRVLEHEVHYPESISFSWRLLVSDCEHYKKRFLWRIRPFKTWKQKFFYS